MGSQQHRQGPGQLSKSAQGVATATTSSNNAKQQAIVICGFAAIGKSTFLEKAQKKGSYNGFTVNDLDSGGFPKGPGSEWPNNYLKAIREQLRQKTILMISTHKGIYTQLLKEGVDLILVYPKRDSEVKQEWKRRIQQREKAKNQKPSDSLWTGVNDNWERWINEYEQQNCPRYEMSKDEYLEDAASRIVHCFQTGSRSSR